MENPQNTKFTLDEARQLIPWLREISEASELKLIDLQRSPMDPELASEEAATIIQHWAETVAKLGALPKQPFTVDFDNGTDFFCWEHPEDDLYYRHSYELG